MDNKIACIFSHFDPHNLIDDYVVFYLKYLANIGCDIVFVTTSPNIQPSEFEKIKPFCKIITSRKNSGRDFGSYKFGINELKNLHDYEKLILANDSVYAPIINNLSDIIEFGDKNNLDIWGATDSFENWYAMPDITELLDSNYHIQSYFMVYSQKVIKSDDFKQFWNQIDLIEVKEQIVIDYEIGGSQYFLKKGYRLGAFYNYLDIKKDVLKNETSFRYRSELERRPFNITHWLWDLLLLKYRFPFVKRTIITDNIFDIKTDHLYDVINKVSNFDSDLIKNHLARTFY